MNKLGFCLMQVKKVGILSLILILFFDNAAVSQNWYRDAQRRERMLRPGLGLQGMEGQGIILQLNRGHFCHNSYFPYFIIEAGWTVENSLNFFSNKTYSTGKWSRGGNQWSTSFFYTFIGLDNWKHVVFSLMLGAGLEAGQRPFEIHQQKFLSKYQGYNLYTRLNINGPTIKINKHSNPMMTNVSVFIGIKYHNEWTSSFDYLRPNLGMVFNLLFPRKVAG